MTLPVTWHLIESDRKRGLGHLRRQQVLAAALAELGVKCKFGLTSTDVPPNLSRDNAEIVSWNPAALPKMEQTDILIVDGVDCGPDWLEPDHRAPLTVVFDDFAKKPVRADVIVNHNIYGESRNYDAYDAGCILAGPKYALIDSSFRRSAPSRRNGWAILVSFGGTDRGGYALAQAAALRRDIPDAPIHVALIDTDAATQKELRSLGCTMYLGRPLSESVRNASLYVGAAGYSLMEATSAGLTPIVCALASDQEPNVRFLVESGLPAFQSFDPTAMSAAATAYYQNPAPLHIAELDGNGAMRLARALLAEFHAQKGLH